MNSTPESPDKCRGPFSFRRCWKFPLILIVALVVKIGILYFLWNDLVPELFHGPRITFLQSLEILLLCKLLVGGKPSWKRFGRGERHDEP